MTLLHAAKCIVNKSCTSTNSFKYCQLLTLCHLVLIIANIITTFVFIIIILYIYKLIGGD